MRAVGIDLAARPSATAVTVIEWGEGSARVSAPRGGWTDDELVGLLMELGPDDRAGVDCPFGWPVEFVRAVSAHAAGEPWPGRGQEQAGYRNGPLRFRRTDVVARELTGAWPQPPALGWLSVVVARWAFIADEMNARGRPIDRTGAGRIAEVYPAGARRLWGLHGERSTAALVHAAPWLEFEPGARQRFDEDTDAYDALIAALVARAVAQGLTNRPSHPDLEVARTEGWLHLPHAGSLAGLL